MSSGGTVAIDIRVLLAAAAVVLLLVILVVEALLQARSGRGPNRSTRVTAFIAGVVLVVSIAVIGVVILN